MSESHLNSIASGYVHDDRRVWGQPRSFRHGTAFRRPLHGFTLIELLVVIAIISLLVSILLPSLKKAKELAQRVLCLTQMHQVHIAFAVYTTDSDGIYPPWYAVPGAGFGNGYRSWPLFLTGQYEGVGFECLPHKDLDSDNGVTDSVLLCPVDPYSESASITTTYGVNYDRFNILYANGKIVPPQLLSSSMLESSSRIVLMYCSATGKVAGSPSNRYLNWNDEDSPKRPRHSDVHNGGYPVLRFDGNASFIEKLGTEDPPIMNSYAEDWKAYW